MRLDTSNQVLNASERNRLKIGPRRSNLAAIEAILYAEKIFDPPSLNDGDGHTESVTVTGARLGDFVLPSWQGNTQELFLNGHVTSSDTVEVRFQNETGVTVNLSINRLRVMVFKRKQ